MRTFREPFRIRAVEPIRLLSRAERREKLERANHNLFRLAAGDVAIDLLREGDAGPFTLDRAAALLRRDDADSATRASSRVESEIRELTGHRHAIATRLGSAAERIAVGLLAGEGTVVYANALGESARANLRFAGARVVPLVAREALDPDSRRPLRGGVDLPALEGALAARSESAPLVLVSLASDPVGGAAVSLDALRAIAAACRRHGAPLWLEASRFAENAFLARRDDPAHSGSRVEDVAREAFRLADGAYACGHRDALSSGGGFLSANDDALAARGRALAALTEGPPFAGGSSGRDFEALSASIREALDEDALAYRHRLCTHLVENLAALGVPVLEPSGADAAYVDAARFLPHVPRSQFPGQALACALYLEGGVRAGEVGSLALGASRETGATPAPFELLRLALPSRGCTEGAVDYVVDLLASLIRQRGEIRGLRIVREPSPELRLHSVELEPVP